MTLTLTQIARRAQIIKDIVKKRPSEHGCTYTVKRIYDYDRGYYRNHMIPDKAFFGHCPIELYTLGVEGLSGLGLTKVIRDIFDKGITQKKNRFHERIVRPVRTYVSDVGIPGLYRVRTSAVPLGYVHAVSQEEAVRVASVTYGFVVVGKETRYGDPERLHVAFSRSGSVVELNALNQADVDDINNKILTIEESIERNKKQIEKFKNDIIAIQMGAITQLGFCDDPE